MNAGLKRYLTILVVTWIASWLVTPTMQMETEHGTAMLTWVEAFGSALLLGTIVWAFSRGRPAQDFVLASRPVFWSILLVGLLQWGRSYGVARDSGAEVGSANFAALLGWQGILIAIGLSGLIYCGQTDRNAGK